MSAQYPILYDRPINKWKVAELKEELKKRGLPVRGLKDELVRRLDEAIQNERVNVGVDSDESDHMKGQLGSGESNLHHMEEPLGDYNPLPPSHFEQMPVVAHKKDVNDAIVDNPVSVDGSSEKAYLEPASTAEAALKSCSFLNEDVGPHVVAGGSETIALNEETEVVPTETVEKVSDTRIEHLKPVQMEAETQSSSQVYEVSSNVGFQVPCESITIDNVNLTNLEKTEIKENVNANNIQLEPEVNRQEIVQSLSHKESAGDDSFYALGDKVPDVKQGYLVEADDKCIIKSSEKTYSADNVSVIDQIMENKAPDQVADDNELVQSAANRIIDDTIKSDVPVERMEPSSGNKIDFVASVGQRELPDDKSSVGNSSDLVGLTTGEPLEKMNLDQSAAADPMEEDNILDKKHTDSDFNSSKECDKIKLPEEISVNEALQAVAPPNISESYVANNDGMVPSSEASELDGTTDAVISAQVDVSFQNIESSLDKKMDIEANVEQRELQDDRSSHATISELVDVKDRDPLEKINLDQSDDSMEDDILDMKHTGGDEMMSDLPSVNEASQANIPANILVSSEKRKIEEGEPVPENKEIRKRQRRWNDETVKMPEQKGLDASLSKVAMAGPGTDGPKSNGADLTNERIVPPSSKTPTDSLRIDNFVRPFTNKALQELLSKTGKHTAFWMDMIKTHCYVTFTSVDEATATRNALYNLRWPENGGRLLVAEFVDPEEVKSRLEASSEPTASVRPPQHPARQITPVNSGPIQSPKHPAKQVAPVHQRVSERVAPALPLVEEPIDSVKTLDDLFRKTKATPRIYYLPLSDEQVALKLGKRRN